MFGIYNFIPLRPLFNDKPRIRICKDVARDDIVITFNYDIAVGDVVHYHISVADDGDRGGGAMCEGVADYAVFVTLDPKRGCFLLEYLFLSVISGIGLVIPENAGEIEDVVLDCRA